MEKFVRFLFKIFRPVLFYISMPLCTKFQYKCLRYLGVRFGQIPPRYLSAKVWFDGANYSSIVIGDGVTISSNVRLLTHDWALDTICDGIHMEGLDKIQRPIGRQVGIEIGDHSFVGTYVVVMPGTTIGKCCIVGAGAVVRGNIPNYSIVIGNPAKIISKNTQQYLEEYLNKSGCL